MTSKNGKADAWNFPYFYYFLNYVGIGTSKGMRRCWVSSQQFSTEKYPTELFLIEGGSKSQKVCFRIADESL